MKKMLVLFVLTIFLAANVSACVVDSDCGEPGEWVYENKCLFNVRYFNPFQASPDQEYIENPKLLEENWQYFILNGILANFENGKKYTWTQQTRYREVPTCEEGICLREKEYKKKSCGYGCDFGGSEQCMCNVKDLANPQCVPGKRDIYVNRQLPYKNLEGECKQTGYEIAYVCSAGRSCKDEDGSAVCKKERTDETGEVTYVEYNYRTTNAKIWFFGEETGNLQFKQPETNNPENLLLRPVQENKQYSANQHSRLYPTR